MNKSFFKSLVCLTIAIICVIGSINAALAILPTEVDYTVDYTIYRELKSTTNVDELRKTMQSMQLEYTLSNNVFDIKEYPNIKFNILDDKTCSIASDKVMENFAYLDSDSIVDVTITTTKEANKIVETLTKVEAGTSYIKKGDLYFVKESTPKIIILPIVIIILAIGFGTHYLVGIISLISKSKKSKATATTSSTTPKTSSPNKNTP